MECLLLAISGQNLRGAEGRERGEGKGGGGRRRGERVEGVEEGEEERGEGRGDIDE